MITDFLLRWCPPYRRWWLRRLYRKHPELKESHARLVAYAERAIESSLLSARLLALISASGVSSNATQIEWAEDDIWKRR